MWPDKKTAVVLIHGAGHHEPFHFMDQIVRGFGEYLEAENPGWDIEWNHKLRKREAWIENYVSLMLPEKPSLDFYEYYWDIYMTHKVNFAEVVDWILEISEGAKRFYKRADLKDALKTYIDQKDPYFKDEEFKSGGYLIFFGKLAILIKVLGVVKDWKLPIPILGGLPEVVSSVAKGLLALLLNTSANFVTKVVADIMTYLGKDERSANYAIRNIILKGAVEHVGGLLKDPNYEQVIIVGHSLGTIIGYDTINRILAEVNAINVNTGPATYTKSQAEKLVGFVTMGSPLDKIAFFFQEEATIEENGAEKPYVRAHLLEHYHGFRGRPLFEEKYPVDIGDPYKFKLARAKWLNFYHDNDPVSGPLDAFEQVDNISCAMQAGWLQEAHGSYWEWDKTFEHIAKAFFQP